MSSWHGRPRRKGEVQKPEAFVWVFPVFWGELFGFALLGDFVSYILYIIILYLFNDFLTKRLIEIHVVQGFWKADPHSFDFFQWGFEIY